MTIRVASIAAIICAGAVFAGCSKKPEADASASPSTPQPPAKVSIGDTAPEAAPPPPPTQAAAVAAQPDGPPQEENTDELTRITRAIQSFAVNYERPPKDLNELVAKKLLPSLPAAPAGKKFLYDPSHMSIKLVNQ